MFVAVVLVIVLAILYEGLKSLREFLASLEIKPARKETRTAAKASSQKGKENTDGNVSLSNSVQSPSHLTSPERTPLLHTKSR